MPKITLDGEDYLEVVGELRLLGIIFQSNMKWFANTLNLCQRGYARLWMLRNLKKHGACTADRVDVYMKQVKMCFRTCCASVELRVKQNGL